MLASATALSHDAGGAPITEEMCRLGLEKEVRLGRMRYEGGKVVEASVIGLVLLMLALVGGRYVAESAVLAPKIMERQIGISAVTVIVALRIPVLRGRNTHTSVVVTRACTRSSR